MQVKLAPPDVKLLQQLITLGEDILAAIKASSAPDFGPIIGHIENIEAQFPTLFSNQQLEIDALKQIEENTKPEPPSDTAVGIEIVPGKPTSQA